MIKVDKIRSGVRIGTLSASSSYHVTIGTVAPGSGLWLTNFERLGRRLPTPKNWVIV